MNKCISHKKSYRYVAHLLKVSSLYGGGGLEKLVIFPKQYNELVAL